MLFTRWRLLLLNRRRTVWSQKEENYIISADHVIAEEVVILTVDRRSIKIRYLCERRTLYVGLFGLVAAIFSSAAMATHKIYNTGNKS